MNTTKSIITEPMVLKLGNTDSIISFTGTCEALAEIEHCRSMPEMEEALARVKENYEEMVANLPQLLEYEAEDKRKIQDTFWVLNQVRKMLGGIKIFKA